MKKNKRGIALVLVLLIMGVLSILGVALLELSVAETRFSVHEENKLQAFYIAKAGAEAVAKIIDKDKEASKKLSATNHESFAGGDYYVKIAHDANNNVTQLISTGTKNGVSQTVVLNLVRRSFFSNAILAQEKIEIQNKNCKITSNGSDIEIIANQTETTGLFYKNSVTQSDVMVDLMDSQIHVGSGRTLPNVELAKVYTSKSFSDYSDSNDKKDDETINSDNDPDNLYISSNTTFDSYNSPYNLKKFETITVDNGKNLTFNLSSGHDFYIMADNLIVNGQISVIGSGNLFVYTDKISINKFFDTDNTTTTYLFVQGSESNISIQTQVRNFFGYIYAPNTAMNVKANFGYTGAIVCKSLTVESGGKVTYNAGNAATLFPEYFGLDKDDYYTGYIKGTWVVK